MAWAYVEKNLAVRRRQQAAEAGNNRLEFDPRELAGGFRKRLAGLIGEAQAVAPLVVVATFSHKVRREQSAEERLAACNTSLYYMPYMSVDGLLDGFEAYNEAIREAARETGAMLVDEPGSIPGDDAHFTDSVHFTDAGCRAMADRVLSKLRDSPQLKDLLSKR